MAYPTRSSGGGMMDELQALLEGATKLLNDSGLKGIVDSWLGNGPNEPVTTRQIEDAFGADEVAEASKQAGVKPDALAAELPEVIDKASPDGKIDIRRSSIEPSSIDARKESLIDVLGHTIDTRRG
ncbi:YidB family protein [Actinacidiphila glaucinigra]|uniref:YidB family protein n=1 Tax=Actinacidiphila glaucinigra TaxID=235986 RepID=UPI00382D1A90